jgi:hypothetical protein
LTEVPHKPGMLKRLAEQLRTARIDIHHLYGSADNAPNCLIVFSSSDNDRAVVTINKP